MKKTIIVIGIMALLLALPVLGFESPYTKATGVQSVFSTCTEFPCMIRQGYEDSGSLCESIRADYEDRKACLIDVAHQTTQIHAAMQWIETRLFGKIRMRKNYEDTLMVFANQSKIRGIVQEKRSVCFACFKR